jgi:hypothetical protein
VFGNQGFEAQKATGENNQTSQAARQGTVSGRYIGSDFGL